MKFIYGNLRPLLRAALIAGAITIAGPAMAQEAYPSHRLTVVVPFAPGGFADTLARIVGQKLNERWGQAVVINNRAGAGGNIGAKFVADAAPDGYTILATTTSVVINETLYKRRIYSIADLATVAISASAPETLVANPIRPSKSLAEFLNWAKGRDLSYASATGTGSHIAAEYFFRAVAKIKATMIPYQGGAPAITAVVGNQVEAAVLTLPPIAPFVTDGRPNGLAVASPRRAAALPNVPTFAEAGYPGVVAVSWVGFFVPAQTRPEIVAALNAAINNAIGEPAIQKRLADLGYEPERRSPAEAAAYVRDQTVRWGEMVRTVGISVD